MTLPAQKTAARAEAQRLLAHFRAQGAGEVEARILQPAAELLDLYGEDIRARAFVTQDPLQGEMMLRQAARVVGQRRRAYGDPAASMAGVDISPPSTLPCCSFQKNSPGGSGTGVAPMRAITSAAILP